MAEPVSSILTIATVSLEVVKKTYRYIKEVAVVDEFVRSLLIKLKDLYRLIRVVESTCERAGSDDNSPSARFVGKTLVLCQKRLSELEPLVYELASQDSETWYDKLTLKRRSDRAKRDIELIEGNIHNYMEHIRTGLSCWSLDVASAHRRISYAIATQHDISIRPDVEHTCNPEVSPLKRTLSDAETLLDLDPRGSLRRASTTTTLSRPSISSTSSHALRAQSDTESTRSSIVSPIVKPNNDWVDFHFQVVKCCGNEARIEEIRSILEHHTAARALAISTDGLRRTPLHLAAQRGDVELARTLVKFGADVDAKDSEPSSVLDLAVAGNHRNFVKFLLEKNVDGRGILDRNEEKFGEMKRIINFSKSAGKGQGKKESRKMSWGSRRGVAV